MENEKGFDGYLLSMRKGHVVSFDPSKGFDLEAWAETFAEMARQEPPREYVLPLGGYAMAVLNKDEKEIARYKRIRRIADIVLFRHFIETFGKEEAKLIAWLTKKHVRLSERSWRLSLYGLKYKGIGEDGWDSVDLILIRQGGLYEIQVRASQGYETVHNDVLRSGITYKSVCNHINYFVKKMK